MRCEVEGYWYDYWLNMGNYDLFYGRLIGEKVVKYLCWFLIYKCYYVFFDRFEMKIIIWLIKIEIYFFFEYLMLIVCVLYYILYFLYNFRFFIFIFLVGIFFYNGIFSCGIIKCDLEGVWLELRNFDFRRGEIL